MPGPLRRCRFLALLYAAHAHADPYGTLHPRGRTGILPSLAAAAALRPDVAARYLAAALAAGLLAHRGGRLALAPAAAVPDWTAAAAVLARPTHALETP